jgi:hypothetical protein
MAKPFKGTINVDIRDSEPDSAIAKAPSCVLILASPTLRSPW